MFRRYVIDKINRRTNCHQGILVTLGDMMHKGLLAGAVKEEVESIFKVLNVDLPTPPHMENESFRNSISWFKKDSPRFAMFEEQIMAATQILKKSGYEILLLEAKQLQDVLYEDAHQILVKAGSNRFEVLDIKIYFITKTVF